MGCWTVWHFTGRMARGMSNWPTPYWKSQVSTATGLKIGDFPEKLKSEVKKVKWRRSRLRECTYSYLHLQGAEAGAPLILVCLPRPWASWTLLSMTLRLPVWLALQQEVPPPSPAEKSRTRCPSLAAWWIGPSTLYLREPRPSPSTSSSKSTETSLIPSSCRNNMNENTWVS